MLPRHLLESWQTPQNATDAALVVIPLSALVFRVVLSSKSAFAVALAPLFTLGSDVSGSLESYQLPTGSAAVVITESCAFKGDTAVLFLLY